MDSVFSRMFAWESPAESRKKWQSVESDLAWGEVLQHLGTTFGTSPWNGQIRHEYRLYTAPANPGRSVPSGRGTSRWSTYDVTDGLGAASVNSLYRDRSGALWFGTGGLGAYGGGVSCYDGQGWTTFTTEDGVAHDQVWSIFQDREIGRAY